MSSYALVPTLVDKSKNRTLTEVLAILTGVTMLSALAQVAIPLPWTPVPITGQTFGVALLALSWGARRSLMSMSAYLLIGSLGLPVFALGRSGLSIGPTTGYLIGMLLTSYVVGLLADKGWTKDYWKGLAAAFCGSLLIYTSGLVVLSFFIPRNQLLVAGLLPFIPGDILKNIFASGLSVKFRKLVK